MLIFYSKKQEYLELKESKDSHTITILTIAEDWISRLEYLINEASGGKLYSSYFNKYCTKHELTRAKIIEQYAPREYVKVRENYKGKIDSQMYIEIVKFICEFWEFGGEFKSEMIDPYWGICSFCIHKHSWATWPFYDSDYGVSTCANLYNYKVKSYKLDAVALDMGLDRTEVIGLIRYFNRNKKNKCNWWRVG